MPASTRRRSSNSVQRRAHGAGVVFGSLITSVCTRRWASGSQPTGSVGAHPPRVIRPVRRTGLNSKMDIQDASEVFNHIRAALPHLRIEPYLANGNVDAGIEVPVQGQLRFVVYLYLTGDELNLTAGKGFWLEWFPATDPQVIAEYREVAVGLLSGEYRVVEHLRGNRLVKGQLQRPDGRGWQTVGTWRDLRSWRPWGAKVTNVLQASRT
jgi:hypothetical protein